MVPKEWKWYSTPDWVSVSLWTADFARRMKQLDEISKATDFTQLPIWLGGLLNPEAFITATRQSAAQSHGWSLENLRLHAESISVKDTAVATDAPVAKSGADGFTVRGLSMEGATWENKALALTNELSVPLAPIRFVWKNQDATASTSGTISTPVYLSETRMELLFAIDLPCPPTPPIQSWFQRSVAIVSWKPDM